MHSGGTGLLGNPADGILHVLAHDHHQIGQLVDDDGDIGHLFQHGVGGRQLVEGFDVTDIVFRKQVVAALHLLHRAAQSTRCLFRLGDDRHQQVGMPLYSASSTTLGQ